jgi:hypothetical protein
VSTPEESTTVRYTAKELFARIDQKLDVIANQLTAKADHEQLVALEVRVALLENGAAESRGWDKARTAIVALVIAVLALLVPIIVPFLS